jgi:arsenate reductase
MAEIGIDISGQRSKSVSDVLDQRYDWVVTVCDKAKESCPAFPGTAAFVHQPFDDPPLLAAAETDEEAALEHYRRVRDEIRAFVRRMPDNLDQKTADRAGDTANAIGRLFDR